MQGKAVGTQCHSLRAPLDHASVEAVGGLTEVDARVKAKELVQVWERVIHRDKTQCTAV